MPALGIYSPGNRGLKGWKGISFNIKWNLKSESKYDLKRNRNISFSYLFLKMSSVSTTRYLSVSPLHLLRTSSGILWLVCWLRPPNAGGPGLIPGQRTGSHMLQIRVLMLQLKILHAATKMKDSCAASKTWHCQTNSFGKWYEAMRHWKGDLTNDSEEGSLHQRTNASVTAGVLEKQAHWMSCKQGFLSCEHAVGGDSVQFSCSVVSDSLRPHE